MRKVLFENDRLRISHDAGSSTSGDAVVAFAGVGRGFQGVVHEEFARTLSEPDSVKEAYFVIDKQRSWYNATADDIVGVLAPELDGRRVLLLGNSMGGFGALLFSGLLPGCRAALSFSPQFSMRVEIVPFENRWREYTDTIQQWRFDTCVSSPRNPVPKLAFFGVGDQRDARHAELLRGVGDPTIDVVTLPDAGHGAIRLLRDAGLLPRLVDEGLQGSLTPGLVAKLLRERAIATAEADAPER